MTTDAETFHVLAGEELDRLGFFLVNDPSQTQGRYSSSSADYERACGLGLSVGFENDSRSAVVFFGRRWSLAGGYAYWSNYYATVAQIFGIDTPIVYPLSWGDKRADEIAAILTDLKRTLPEVIKRVTLEDLIHVERETFGAETIARMQLGEDFRRLVQVSSFRGPNG